MLNHPSDRIISFIESRHIRYVRSLKIEEIKFSTRKIVTRFQESTLLFM